MSKKVVLVGVKDYTTACEFMDGVSNGLMADGIDTRVSDNTRMCLETPHTKIHFIYNPAYQQLHGLRADVVFGLPEYVKPLYAYLSTDTILQPQMGLREWVVECEKAYRNRENYQRQLFVNTIKSALNSFYGRPRRPVFPEIKRVHFSGPVTCVIWSDGTKTLVRCGENDTIDYEKGLAMAIAKKVFGTNKSGSNYYDIFKQWLPKPEEETFVELPLDADMIQTGTLCIDCEEPAMEETEEVTPDA